MKCVGKDNVAKDPSRIVVEINGGIALEIAREIESEANGGRIFLAALPIDLHSPGFIKIVGVTENRSCNPRVSHQR